MLKRFPKLEPSYDKVIHKKVQSDLFSVVPKGERAWLWFTYTGGKNACFVVKGKDVCMYTTCFADELALGTILYGTLFKINGHTHFACQDILYYEGFNITNDSFELRLTKMTIMFQTQVKKSLLLNSLIIGAVIFTKTYEEAYKHSESVPYSVYGIRHLQENGNSLGLLPIKQNVVREAIFKVRADIKDDIYHLHYTGDKGEPLTAAVPSYKRSVSLNSIFRNIKENKNLDTLEESDDETEFEDIREDRHVDLKKIVLMRCIYHKRFQKWEPVSLVKGRQVKVATAAEVK